MSGMVNPAEQVNELKERLKRLEDANTELNQIVMKKDRALQETNSALDDAVTELNKYKAMVDIITSVLNIGNPK